MLTQVWAAKKYTGLMPNDTRADRFETERLDKITKVCWVFASVGGLVLLVAFGGVWGTGWGPNLFAPGATLATAALAGLVTTSGIVSWKEQRFRERERAGYVHREKEYEQVVSHLMARFLKGDYDVVADAQSRGRAAVWAGPDVISALAKWQQEVGRVIDAGTIVNGKVTLSADQQLQLKQLLANVVLAMRRDLETVGEESDVSGGDILKSIFND